MKRDNSTMFEKRYYLMQLVMKLIPEMTLSLEILSENIRVSNYKWRLSIKGAFGYEIRKII